MAIKINNLEHRWLESPKLDSNHRLPDSNQTKTTFLWDLVMEVWLESHVLMTRIMWLNYKQYDSNHKIIFVLLIESWLKSLHLLAWIILFAYDPNQTSNFSHFCVKSPSHIKNNFSQNLSQCWKIYISTINLKFWHFGGYMWMG